MDKIYYDYAKKCCKKGGGWKVVSVVLFMMFATAALAAILQKIKCDGYRDMLIKKSNEFPNTPEQEEELAMLRRRSWATAHSPANRVSDEERLAENRIIEEE